MPEPREDHGIAQVETSYKVISHVLKDALEPIPDDARLLRVEEEGGSSRLVFTFESDEWPEHWEAGNYKDLGTNEGNAYNVMVDDHYE